MKNLHCPTCEQLFDPAKTTAMPFCSERCRLVDLGRWLDEEPSVPHVSDPDEEFDEPWLDESQ